MRATHYSDFHPTHPGAACGQPRSPELITTGKIGEVNCAHCRRTLVFQDALSVRRGERRSKRS